MKKKEVNENKKLKRKNISLSREGSAYSRENMARRKYRRLDNHRNKNMIS